MSLFGRKAKLKWDGEDYEVLITADLLLTVDEQINIVQTALTLDKGTVPPIAKIAKLYSLMLGSAGVIATHEAVYEKMYSNMVDGDFELIILAKTLISLFIPSIEEPERKPVKKGKAKG